MIRIAKTIGICIIAAIALVFACSCAPVGFKTPPVGNNNSNTNTENTNTNENTNTSNPATGSVEAGTIPAFAIHRTNYAWGFNDSFTLVYLDGRTFIWTNPNKDGKNESVMKGKDVPDAQLIHEMTSNTEDIEASSSTKNPEIQDIWEETLQCNFDAQRSESELVALDYGSVTIYVFDRDGNAHWISTSGDTESHLEDGHADAAIKAFGANL